MARALRRGRERKRNHGGIGARKKGERVRVGVEGGF